MNVLVRTSAVALIGLSAAAANAGVTLPSGAATVRFNPESLVFSTSVLPTINEATGVPNPPSGPIQLTAFGSVATLTDGADSLNKGTIGPTDQLTFALSGAILTPTGLPTLESQSATSVKWAIQSTVSGVGGTAGPNVVVYDKDLTKAPALNAFTFKGTPATSVVPSVVSSGATPYLTFDNVAGLEATIIVKWEKVGGSSTFNKRTIELQEFGNTDTFPVTGGTAAGLFSVAIAGNGQQVGPNIVTAAKGSSVGSTPVWIGGSFGLEVARAVPEPASLAMLVLGGMLIGFRGRTRREA